MTSSQPSVLPDKERIERLCELTKAPPWLRDAVAFIAGEAHEIRPLNDERSSLPALIYRH
jgi:hypothetical protein